MISAGDCPVCSDSGELIAIVTNQRCEILLTCPFCHIIGSLPRGGTPDDLENLPALREYAPEGARLASVEDLRAFGRLDLFVREASLDSWPGFLDELAPKG